MTITYIVIAAILLITVLLYFKSNTSSGSFNNVSVIDAKNIIKEKNTVIIDVRTRSEISEGKIKNAMEIELGPSIKSKFDGLDKNKKYIVYCRSGRRSVLASNMMIKMGFSNVNNLLGGYNAWSNT